MAYPDLEEARRHHAALKSLIERHAGDAPDFRALRRAVDLCRGAAEAVDDAYCREKIRLAAATIAEESVPPLSIEAVAPSSRQRTACTKSARNAST